MRLRALQALAGGHIGGTEMSVFSLAPKLRDSGLEVEISLLDGHGPVSEAHRHEGIAIHDLSAGGGGLAGVALRFRRLLVDGQFEVVHLYGIRMATLGRVVARTLRRRPALVHGIRGLHVTEGEDATDRRTRLVMTVERYLAGWTDAYLANSAGAVEFMTAHGIPAAKFTVIPNAVDLDRWAPAGPRPARLAPMAVCVANFRPRKRQEDLVEAMAVVSRAGVALTCRFVGDGPTRVALQRRTSELGLAHCVEFSGRAHPAELPGILAHADICVLPSAWEGMSVGMLEAMAAGLPVVATDVPGTREVVASGQTGFLVPVRRPDLLAERLIALARDAGLRAEMGAAGRRRVEDCFSLAASVRRHLDAYRRVTENLPVWTNR